MIVGSLSKMGIHMAKNLWRIWDCVEEIEYGNDIQIQPPRMHIFDEDHYLQTLFL